MKHFLLIPIFGILLSCNIKSQNDIKREVYMGFKLGSGRHEAESRFISLLKNKTLKPMDKKNVYVENKISPNKFYYSFFWYNIPTTDSIVDKLQVVYSDALDDGFSTLANYVPAKFYKDVSNYLSLTDSDISRDIIRNVSLNYKNYDNADTVTLEGTTFMSYHWNNRNGVNIELSHDTRSPSYDPLSNSVRHYYYIQLTYSYTDEMREKIFKKKSIY